MTLENKQRKGECRLCAAPLPDDIYTAGGFGMTRCSRCSLGKWVNAGFFS